MRLDRSKRDASLKVTAEESRSHSEIDKGEGRGTSSFRAAVSVEDEVKQSLFESIGFRNTGPGEPFDLGGRDVPRCDLNGGEGYKLGRFMVYCPPTSDVRMLLGLKDVRRS